MRIFCFILLHSKNSFSVKVEKDKTVEDLRSAIIDKAKLKNDNFELFKVKHLDPYVDGWNLISYQATTTRFCCTASNQSSNEGGVANVVQRRAVAATFQLAPASRHPCCHTTLSSS